MSELIKNLRNQILFILTKAVDSKVNGAELTKKLDKELDEKLGKVISEKIQRGPLANLLLEMLEGLFDEDPRAVAIILEAKVKEIREKYPESPK